MYKGISNQKEKSISIERVKSAKSKNNILISQSGQMLWVTTKNNRPNVTPKQVL